MKNMFSFVLLLGLTGLGQTATAQSTSDAIHRDIVVLDGHNDVIIRSILKGQDISHRLDVGHTDLPRLAEGGVDVQVFAVFSDDKKWQTGAFKHANDQIDALEAVVKKNSDKIQFAASTDDVQRILDEGKMVAVVGVESGNMIENSLENLEALYRRGARYLTLTWNYNLPWISAAAEEVKNPTSKSNGLNDFGKSVVRKMNELGMMIDLSHVGEKAFYDVIQTSTKPVLVSHSNAYALTPHFRNLKDEQLVALKANGGVVGVNFYSGFLDASYEERVTQLYREHVGGAPDSTMYIGARYAKLPSEVKRMADAPLESLLQHIDYLVKAVGIEHVAIGSDFDGIESSPQGLEDVSKFPVLTAALLERGYSQSDVAKIMGLNFLRIWKENEEG